MLNKPTIGRLEYFFYAYIIAALPSGLASHYLHENGGQYTGTIWFLYIISFVIVLTAAVKRLGDLNLSPVLCILLFVPILNILFALYLLFASGS